MNFSKTTSYALMILNEMAGNPDRKYTAKYLSRQLKIPYQYIRQLLTDLTRCGLVVSEQGRKGGFFLRLPASEIFLSDVIEAVEGLNIMDKCIVGFDTCPFDKHCALHETWEETRNAVLQVLRKTSLAHFVKEHGD